MRVSEIAAGSSPHTRGALDRPVVFDVSSRIIPAYAGSTWPFLSSLLMISDHPRIRGEHQLRAETDRKIQGSSPHTRGAQLCAVIVGTSNGIIPAYAGSTTATNVSSLTATDHPRIRGEHIPQS